MSSFTSGKRSNPNPNLDLDVTQALILNCYIISEQATYRMNAGRRSRMEMSVFRVVDGDFPSTHRPVRRRAPVSRGRRASSVPSISRSVGRYLPPAGGRGRAWSPWSARAVICPVVRRRHLLGTLPINRARELLATGIETTKHLSRLLHRPTRT